MLLQVNRETVYCYTGGKPTDPDLPTVVFIHGAQHDHSVWALQSRYFAHHGFNVLALDLPGHARSSGAPLTSIEALAEWLIEVLRQTQTQQAMLIGHSMGALIALQTAAQIPDRIFKLALVGATYPMRVSDQLLKTAQHQEASAIEMVNQWSHQFSTHYPSSPAPGFSVLNVNRRLMQHISRNNPAPVFHTDFVACNTYQGGAQAAHKITCPTLFVLAQNDKMTPVKSAQAFIASIPHGRVALIPKSGHALMAEQAEAVLQALFSFALETTEVA